jgi:hypothetical protein
VRLGAQGGVLRGEEQLQALRGAPFDVILDPPRAVYAALNQKLLAVDGRWVVVYLVVGQAELDLALGKRIQLIGSTPAATDEAVQGRFAARPAAICLATL